MNKRVVTFGEIMLRLAPNGYYRFFQNDQLQATFGLCYQAARPRHRPGGGQRPAQLWR